MLIHIIALLPLKVGVILQMRKLRFQTRVSGLLGRALNHCRYCCPTSDCWLCSQTCRIQLKVQESCLSDTTRHYDFLFVLPTFPPCSQSDLFKTKSNIPHFKSYTSHRALGALQGLAPGLVSSALRYTSLPWNPSTHSEPLPVLFPPPRSLPSHC